MSSSMSHFKVLTSNFWQKLTTVYCVKLNVKHKQSLSLMNMLAGHLLVEVTQAKGVVCKKWTGLAVLNIR